MLARAPRLRRWRWWLVLFVVGLLLGMALRYELLSSSLQSLLLSRQAQKLTFAVGEGKSESIRFPPFGPFDQRLGYALLPGLLERLLARGYVLTAQARLSKDHREWIDQGLFAIYHEKAQAGLTILDRHHQAIFTAHYPQLIYNEFADIPRAVVDTLLFIENRELLDERYPYKNPVVEWDRLVRAVFDLVLAKFVDDHDVPGGSTLATQIEKYRHSPEGRTAAPKDKLVQMASAMVRAYQDGRSTVAARQRVVRDYINTVPLGAVPGGGEVRGLGHGLAAWHGASFQVTNQLLADISGQDLQGEELKTKARAYKEVLSLFLAQRRPAYYLQSNREALAALTDRHLSALVQAKVLTHEFAAAVRQEKLSFRNNMIVFQPERLDFLERKGANAVRVHLLSLFGFDRLYSLDRLDLKVHSTLDLPAQKAVSQILTKLKQKDFAEQSGLMGERLLGRGDPSEVIYSFTLRERRGQASLLRVQADNVDGPFNVNDGGKLELGSTAKLRTLVSYLEIVESMWASYHQHPPQALAPTSALVSGYFRQDALGLWCLQWLHATPLEQRSLGAMLRAAMLERQFSASPHEQFFTGGGLHRFSNFTKEDDARVVNAEEALKRSINLPFVRMMREVVMHYLGRIPDADTMLKDPDSPSRRQYLERFANKEGRQFLGRFYLKYRGLEPSKRVKALLAKSALTSRRLAAVYSVLNANGSEEGLAEFIRVHGAGDISPKVVAALSKEMLHGKLNLHDKGYIAGVHPLELWLVAYLQAVPDASFTQVVKASAAERQAVYAWLFNSKTKARQDSRIRIMLEQEAFQAIHDKWQRLGYPFHTLVPTFATALGSSGDKPSALAELVGIISQDGIKTTPARVEKLNFAGGTPFASELTAVFPEAQRVLSPELCGVVRQALAKVVEEGTAVRVRQAFVGKDGKPLVVGGKTGTGDNRYSIFAPGGKVIESKVVSRTATFVFFIGDRFFGTLTAFVPSARAAEYSFTSALPVQILKILAPVLQPLIQGE